MINIPAIPLPIYIYLRKRTHNSNLVNWRVKNGEWVQKNQVIATYNVKPIKVRSGFFSRRKIEPNVIAPFDGVIEEIFDIEYTEYPNYSSWKDFVGHQSKEIHFQNLKTFFSIRPTEKIDVISLSEVYTNIIDYIYFTTDEKNPRDGCIALSPNQILFNTNMLVYTTILINK